MSSKKKLPWLGLALAKQLDMTSLPEAKKREAVKQRLYPSILPAHSERGFPFFCLNRASSFFTVFGLSPTERQSMLAKLLKTSWDFQICLCVRNLTFGPIFSSKTTKCRRVISVSLPHMGVPPCHGDRGPPCFLLGFSLQWESQFEAGKNFLSGKFARCWK